MDPDESNSPECREEARANNPLGSFIISPSIYAQLINMATRIMPSEIASPRLGSLSTRAKVRFGAFSIVALALLVLNGVMTPSHVLTAPFVGWIQDLGTHQVHDMTIAALIWLMLMIPLVLLLYHPMTRVNTVLAPLVLLVPHAVLAYLVDSFLFMPMVVMSSLALLVVLLHPAGRSLARFDRIETIDKRLVGVYVLAAIPLLVYAGLEVAKQLGPVDEHVVIVHYGGMAVGAFYIVLMGALAVARVRDWRYATWSTGSVAAFIGLVSVVYPTVESSVGVIGGSLLVLWAVAFVAGVEYTRRSYGVSPAESVDEAATKPA